MTYIDEKILENKEEIKREKYRSLENGFYIAGKVLKFERVELLEAMSVMLPNIMKQMPEIYAKIKYPSEFRPQMIYTTLDLSVNMGFTVFPSEIKNNEMQKLAERMSSAIHRDHPDYRMYVSRNLSGTDGYWFAFRSHAMDSDLYNMMLAIPLGEKLLQCSFNCYYREHQKWRDLVLMIWKSITALEEV